MHASYSFGYPVIPGPDGGTGFKSYHGPNNHYMYKEGDGFDEYPFFHALSEDFPQHIHDTKYVPCHHLRKMSSARGNLTHHNGGPLGIFIQIAGKGADIDS